MFARRIAREQSFCVLCDGSFYVVHRTVDGQPAYSYSRDGGHARSRPQYVSYADRGKRLRIGPELSGRVHDLRIYGRALRTSEAVANYRAKAGHLQQSVCGGAGAGKPALAAAR